MDEEQSYKLDCQGWFALDGALDAETCAQLLSSGDEALAQETLLRSSAVAPLLDDVFENGWSGHPGAVSLMAGGDGFRVDRPPSFMESADGGKPASLWRGGSIRPGGGRTEISLSREYWHSYGVRHCQGLLLVLALDDIEPDDGGFALVPCSHRNEVPTPAALYDGAPLAQHTVHCPPLKQGTVLLLVPSLLRRLPTRQLPLLCVDLASNSARPTPGGDASAQQLEAGWQNFNRPGDEERPAWASDGQLDALQSAVLERASMRHDDSLVIRTSPDGQQAWVEQAAEPEPPPPPLSAHEARDWMDKWLFDLRGWLVVPDLLDAAWLAEANAVLDAEVAAVEQRLAAEASPATAAPSSAETGSRFSPAAPGAPSISVGDLFSLKDGLFRRLIALPPVLHRLNWMLGDGYRQSGEPRAICNAPGSNGHGLHSGTLPSTPGNGWQWMAAEGIGLTHSLNVAFQLRDVAEADGGFVAISGSQRANYPTPEGLMQSDPQGSIQHIAAPAGSAILFNGGATAHGAWGWTGREGRQAIIVNYLSRFIEYPRF